MASWFAFTLALPALGAPAPTANTADPSGQALVAGRGTAHVFALSPMSFVTDGLVVVSSEGLVISINNIGQACGHAPVVLPDGASVQSFLGWISDPGMTQDATISLLRQPLGGAALTMASFQTAATTTGLQLYADLSVDQPVIDNALYSYSVEVCFYNGGSAEVEVRGVYLIYEEGPA